MTKGGEQEVFRHFAHISHLNNSSNCSVGGWFYEEFLAKECDDEIVQDLFKRMILVWLDFFSAMNFPNEKRFLSRVDKFKMPLHN